MTEIVQRRFSGCIRFPLAADPTVVASQLRNEMMMSVFH